MGHGGSMIGGQSPEGARCHRCVCSTQPAWAPSYEPEGQRGVAGRKAQAHAEFSWNWPECTGNGSGHPCGRRVQRQGAGVRKLAKARTCLPWRDPIFCTEEAECLLSRM